jgi:ATP-binding cassette subfamily B protein
LRRRFRLMVAVPWIAAPRKMLAVVSLQLGNGVAGLLTGVWLKLITDSIVGHAVTPAVIFAIILALSIALTVAATTMHDLMQMEVSEKAQLVINDEYLRPYMSIPGLAHLETPKLQDRMGVIRDETGTLAGAGFTIVGGVVLAVQLGGTGLLLARVAPILLLLPLFAVPSLIAAPISQLVSTKIRERAQRWQRLEGHLTWMFSGAHAAPEIRMFGLQDELLKRARDAWKKWLRLTLLGEVLMGAINTFAWLFFAVGYIAALWVVVSQAATHRSSVGDVILVLTLAAQVHGQVGGMVGVISGIANSYRVVGRLLWLQRYSTDEARPNEPRQQAPDAIARGLFLSGVSFRYPETDRDVVSEVSIHIPAGSTVALVGENGAGKTTLVKLLARFYKPTTGSISVDGVDLDHVSTEEWRARLAGAFQDHANIEVLVRETVGVGDVARVEDGPAVLAALDRAESVSVLEHLPEGLETQLGRVYGGEELSGGQWQKLALGRAMMREAPLLLLLDEPTSALDAQSEHALFEQYARRAAEGAARNGAITLLISHRFSTARMADLIIVMEKGRVVDSGTHAQLLSRDGLYAELYRLQASAYQ